MVNYGATTSSPSSSSSPRPRSPLLLPHRRAIPPSPAQSDFSTATWDTGLTHAEQQEYERGLLTWERAKHWRFWFRWSWAPAYLVLVALVLGGCLVAVYHREIIRELMPVVRGLQDMRGGWLIPIAVIAVLSFPPLFGNVIILVGVVWGIRWGFAIVAAGTLIGEMVCFTVFKTCCSRRARRFSRQNLNYACLSRVVTDGGLFMACVVRLSAIPTHMSTVVLAVCGLDYVHFFAAMILALPKQFVAVYLGEKVSGGGERKKGESRKLSHAVVASTIAATLLSLWYVHRKMLKVRKAVFLSMREDLARRGVDEPAPPDSP